MFCKIVQFNSCLQSGYRESFFGQIASFSKPDYLSTFCVISVSELYQVLMARQHKEDIVHLPFIALLFESWESLVN